MPLSTYAADNVLAHLLGQATWTAPTNTFFSLHIADPGLTGASEVSYSGYNRVQASWNTPTTSGITNNGDHSFSAVSGADVTVTHIGLWDASSAGNFLFSIDVADTLFITGAVPKILNTAVTLTPGSAYHEDIIPAIAGHLTGQAAMPFDNSVYVALFTAAPSQSTNGTEVSGGSYARQLIEFNAPSGGAIDNTNDEDFPAATSNLGTVVALAIMDGNLGNDFRLFGALTSNVTVNNGDDYRISAGALDLSI